MQLTSGLALWMVLSAAASLEFYDELSPDNMDGPETIYQEYNSLDTGPMVQMHKPEEATLLKILQKQDFQSKRHYQTYRPNWDATDLELFDRSHSNDPQVVDVENTIVKRLSNSLRRRTNPFKPAMMPQPKLKIKKGKAIGSQMVCYFKLCAFRSPT